MKVFLFHLKSSFRLLDGLIRKLNLISKFMASSTVKQIITIHILPHISKSKDNETVIFSELIEYNMRNISLEKS